MSASTWSFCTSAASSGGGSPRQGTVLAQIRWTFPQNSSHAKISGVTMETIQEDSREGTCSRSSTVTNDQVEIENLKRENDLLKLVAALTSRNSSMTACTTHEELEDVKMENEKGRDSLQAKPSMVVSTFLMEKELEVSRLENAKRVLQLENDKLVLELENGKLVLQLEKLRATSEAKSVAAPTATPRELRDTIEVKSVAAPTATPGEFRATKEAKTLVPSATMQQLLKREIDEKSTEEAKISTLRKELDRANRENDKLNREKDKLQDHKTLSETERRRLSRLEKQDALDTQKRTEEIKNLVLEGQTLDLAFLVDATGSMQSIINMVKEKIKEMAAGVGKAYPDGKLRVAFVAYRDYEDDLVTERCEFTDHLSTFIKALSKLYAIGGGDDAEDVFSGLQGIASLNWTSQNRLLFHIADAPCHGRRFHNGVDDDFPRGDMQGRRIEDLLSSLRTDCKITKYFFCHLNKDTEKMVQEFKNADNEIGDWIQQELFSNINKIPLVVVTTCIKTIHQTMSTVGVAGNAAKYVPEVVKKGQPSWGSIATLQGQKTKHKRYSKVNHLLYRIRTKQSLELEEVEWCNVQMAQNPFSSEGSIRWPYYAQVGTVPGPPGHTIPVSSSPMVVKRFKIPLGKDVREFHKKEKYFEQMEVQTVSAHMATEFNKRIQNLHGVKTVEFTEVSVLEVKGKFYNMEMLLKGKWIKYNSNGGYINVEEYTATLQAFTHWTYEYSDKLLMVTDLQGVRAPDSDGHMRFRLCDPAIHCTDVLRFTKTNLGPEGFKLFLNTHKCNDVCKNLKLKPGRNGVTTSGTIVGH